ncbi:MAG: hypothetical protein QG585_432 [Patescibacteria group bacterium]|jgi:hypothetical protein|nr:hypothetical protein [Patescibacteria group bacterium]
MKNKKILFSLLILGLLSFGNPNQVFGQGADLWNNSIGSSLSSDSSTAASTSGGGATFNCATQKPKNIGELFEYAICILGNVVIPFLISLALVMFIAGIVKYVANGDNEEKREAGRGLMLFGIVALFVMVSVWGLVKILYSSIFDGEFTTTALPKRATEPFK